MYKGKILFGLCLIVIVLTLLGMESPAEPRAARAKPKNSTPLTGTNGLVDLSHFQQIVAQTLSQNNLKGVHVGFKVLELHSGKVLYDVNGDGLFNPASNMKIVTTAAALSSLGAAYRFQTSFKSLIPPDVSGLLAGDLYIVGHGDPWLVEEALTQAAEDLYRSGLRSISGDVVVDDTFFDDQRMIPGWGKRTRSHCYDAPIGALSVNFNSAAVRVTPAATAGQKAEVDLIPKTAFFNVKNTVTTIAKGKSQIIIKAIPNRQRGQDLLVQGRIVVGSGVSQYNCVRINNPPLFAGWTFYEHLRLRGIKIGGSVKTGHADENVRHTLFHYMSPPLGELIGYLNKESNNFMAEQTIKTLGAERRGGNGTWEKGSQEAGAFLTQITGIGPGGYEITNGSGLGKGNRLSPDLLVKVLQHMYTHPQYASAFVSSLPVMGVDGTLRRRHRNDEASHRIRAKTGFLNNVISLSGYVDTRGCDKLVFSLLLNADGKSRVNLRKVQDALIIAMTNLALDPNKRDCLAPLKPN